MRKGEIGIIPGSQGTSSYIVKEESAEKVAEAILDAIAKYKKHEIKDNHVNKFLEKFSRENLALKLMKIIEGNLDNFN